MHQHVHDKIQSNGTKTRSSSKKIALSDLEVLHTETFGRSQCVSVRPSVMSTMSWWWWFGRWAMLGVLKWWRENHKRIVSLSTKSPAVRHCWLLLPRAWSDRIRWNRRWPTRKVTWHHFFIAAVRGQNIYWILVKNEEKNFMFSVIDC